MTPDEVAETAASWLKNGVYSQLQQLIASTKGAQGGILKTRNSAPISQTRPYLL